MSLLLVIGKALTFEAYVSAWGKSQLTPKQKLQLTNFSKTIFPAISGCFKKTNCSANRTFNK